MNTKKSLIIAWAIILVLVILLGIFLIINPVDVSESIKTETVITEDIATNTDNVEEDNISSIINSLTLEQKVGQLFLARVPATDQIYDIQTYQLGGYLIFGRDIEGETQDSLRAKIDSWQQASNLPLLIASDEEGGIVTRVSEILDTPFASPGSLYNEGGLDAVIADATTKSQTLKSLGINLNLAPVADVAINPYSFIYDRTLMLPVETSLIDAADITAQYVSGVVGAMKAENLGSCLKHFPGYGENEDSHTDIIVDQKDLATFEEIDFIPFEAGINAGAGGVLISHNIAVAIDPNVPASISKPVHDILRNELNFQGVIVTDDFDMAGLADFTDLQTATIDTINAGTDLIISSSYATQIDYVLEAVNNGTISEDTINDAVRRVLTWKTDLGLL